MLNQALGHCSLIQFVSNVAVHPSGYGTCAWIICAHDNLWTGKWYVPAPPSKLYSGLAEAYGIYMLLSFLPIHMTLPTHNSHSTCHTHLLWQQWCYHLDQWAPAYTLPTTNHPWQLSNLCRNTSPDSNVTPLLLQVSLCQRSPRQAERPTLVYPRMPQHQLWQASLPNATATPNMDLSQHPKCPASYPHICLGKAVVT